MPGHKHRFVELGRVPVVLVRRSCPCGVVRFDFESQDGRKVGVSLPAAAIESTRTGVDIGRQTVEVIGALAELWQRVTKAVR